MAADEWISVGERLPESGRTVLLGFRNVAGNWRTVRGEYTARFSIEVDCDEDECGEYNEANDTFYRSEGFYETPEEGDLCYKLANVTDWHPLPAPPKAA